MEPARGPNDGDPPAPAPITDQDANVELFLQMIQDHNGTHVYQNSKAMLGYVEAGKFMYVPKRMIELAERQGALSVDLAVVGRSNGAHEMQSQLGVDYKRDNVYDLWTRNGDTAPNAQANARRPDIAPGESSLLMAKMTTVNYLSLKSAGLDSPTAFVAAALRARWASTGGLRDLVSTVDDTGAEYLSFDETSIEYGQIYAAESIRAIYQVLDADGRAMFAEMRSEEYGSQWVNNNFTNLLAAVESCFRVRGHHYKKNAREASGTTDGYKLFYERYMNACNEGKWHWPEAVDRFEIFHTAVHPFKLKALAKTTWHYLAFGSLAPAAVIRLSGSPCGNAVITTSLAGLELVRAEVWYSRFAAAYGDLIKDLEGFAEAVNHNKYGYHQSAALYGLNKASTVPSLSTLDSEGNPKMVTIEFAKSRSAIMAAIAAAICLALFDARESKLITNFSMSNAQAINKAANEMPMLVLRFKFLITASMNQVIESTDVNDTLNIVFSDTATSAIRKNIDGDAKKG